MLTVLGVLRYDKLHFIGNCQGTQVAGAKGEEGL